MEAILFTGLQGSGKSTFYKQRFFSTHVRISLDLLGTRNREDRLLDVCIETEQKFVIDNTNPTRIERAKYIRRAGAAGFRIVGCYFQSKVNDCLQRNAERKRRVPDVAIFSTIKKLELPTFAEGFDEMKYVRIGEAGFVVEEWNDEI